VFLFGFCSDYEMREKHPRTQQLDLLVFFSCTFTFEAPQILETEPDASSIMT